MKDNRIKQPWCWYCGCKTMEPVQDHYRCNKCGATWNETPSPGVYPMVEEKGFGDSVLHYHARSRVLKTPKEGSNHKETE